MEDIPPTSSVAVFMLHSFAASDRPSRIVTTLSLSPVVWV
jgi:hypothetical protein